MASYLSYFTSGGSTTSSTNTTSPLGNAASTWSNTFSSRIATLRKALTKDSEEDDPDNEDCSHVSNVLRAYYTEKGRTFPEWLPPDPNKPSAAPIMQQQQPQYGQYGANAYNTSYSNPAHGRGGSGGASGGRGGLSDLWDSSPAPAAVAPSPQSLRTPRPTPHALRSQDSSHSQTGDNGLTASFAQRGGGARPLPSQRVGSYQTSSSASQATLGSKDRLRARLQGGGSGRNSPVPPGSSGQPYSHSNSGGNYDSQVAGGSAHGSAAESSWSSSGANPYSNDSSYNSNPSAGNPYGNQNYRQRPGGPR